MRLIEVWLFIVSLAVLLLAVDDWRDVRREKELENIAEKANRAQGVIAGYMSKPPWLEIRRNHEAMLWDLHVRVSSLEGRPPPVVYWETGKRWSYSFEEE